MSKHPIEADAVICNSSAVDSGVRAFTYRAIAPPMWAMVGLCGAELAVVHPVIAHWTVWGAIVAGLLSAAVTGWLIYGLLSMPRLPVLAGPDTLVMRAGRIKAVRVPLAQVRGLRHDPSAAEVKRRDVLNLALLSHPNVLVDLITPLPGRRGVIAVAHRLDDPVAFAAALEQARSGLRKADLRK